jgi:anti-sigma factor RsiW
MHCEDYSELIVGYVDGELADAEVVLLTNHVSDCKRCCKSLQDINDLKSLLQQYAATRVLPPSLGFSRKVMQDVQKEAPILRRRVFWWVYRQPGTTWIAAATILLALLAGFLYLQIQAQKSSPYEARSDQQKPIELADSSRSYRITISSKKPSSEVAGPSLSSYSQNYLIPLPSQVGPEKTDLNNIKDYVYQHAMGGSRTPLTDNTVLVDYIK